MLHGNTDNLDALIREEKEKVAQELFQEAWNSALQEGIEPSILAESAIVSALTHLQQSEGESAVSELVESLPSRMDSGHFCPNRVLQ